jgi:hypothetical protein
LLIAAEAGYHPDFAVIAARQLRLAVGESSKVTAFFQGHPRWTTREQRAEGIRDRALALFSSKWPGVTASPGGEPPTIVAVDDWKLHKGDKDIAVSFTTDVRSVKNIPVCLTAWLVRDKPTVGVAVAERTYISSAEDTWNVTVERKSKDHFGKRYIKIVATMSDQVLWETESKKLD